MNFVKYNPTTRTVSPGEVIAGNVSSEAIPQPELISSQLVILEAEGWVPGDATWRIVAPAEAVADVSLTGHTYIQNGQIITRGSFSATRNAATDAATPAGNRINYAAGLLLQYIA